MTTLINICYTMYEYGNSIWKIDYITFQKILIKTLFLILIKIKNSYKPVCLHLQKYRLTVYGSNYQYYL